MIDCYPPSDARIALIEMRHLAGTERAYLNQIWRARDAMQGRARKSHPGWPFVRVADISPEKSKTAEIKSLATARARKK